MGRIVGVGAIKEPKVYTEQEVAKIVENAVKDALAKSNKDKAEKTEKAKSNKDKAEKTEKAKSNKDKAEKTETE